jgi:hypothetical protein
MATAYADQGRGSRSSPEARQQPSTIAPLPCSHRRVVAEADLPYGKAATLTVTSCHRRHRRGGLIAVRCRVSATHGVRHRSRGAGRGGVGQGWLQGRGGEMSIVRDRGSSDGLPLLPRTARVGACCAAPPSAAFLSPTKPPPRPASNAVGSWRARGDAAGTNEIDAVMAAQGALVDAVHALRPCFATKAGLCSRVETPAGAALRAGGCPAGPRTIARFRGAHPLGLARCL